MYKISFGLILYHIDHCRSYRAKSFYTYIKYMISKHIFKITFLNKSDSLFVGWGGVAQLNGLT